VRLCGHCAGAGRIRLEGVMQDLSALDKAIQSIESQINVEMNEIVDEHGLHGLLTALVNVGTALLSKAIVLTQDEKRDLLITTIDMLVDSRVHEGDAAIKSSVIITKAMGSTCRPH
jgi:hypothetical protein